MRRGLFALALALAAMQPPLIATPGQPAPSPSRIVSLIPAVTEMIFSMGAGARLVGVSRYDRYPLDVERIERVGGLLDPNVERILSLRPDLVILYGTQQELKERLDRAHIAYCAYEHRALGDITDTIRAVGVRIGFGDQARQLASDMERDLGGIRRATAGLAHARTLLVFGRNSGSLQDIDASGGYGFLHDMLEVAGGENVFADLKRQSVQPSVEMILARRPEVIVELRYGDSANVDPAREVAVWNQLPSLPAVRNHRVYLLVGDEFVVPGPRVVAATRRLARLLHPDVIR